MRPIRLVTFVTAMVSIAPGAWSADVAKGPHDWLNRGTFVATLELEPPATSAPNPGPAPLSAIRIRFFQIR